MAGVTNEATALYEYVCVASTAFVLVRFLLCGMHCC